MNIAFDAHIAPFHAFTVWSLRSFYEVRQENAELACDLLSTTVSPSMAIIVK